MGLVDNDAVVAVAVEAEEEEHQRRHHAHATALAAEAILNGAGSDGVGFVRGVVVEDGLGGFVESGSVAGRRGHRGGFS